MNTRITFKLGKTVLASCAVLLFFGSSAFATKYRPPIVDEEIPEETPVVPSPKVIKSNKAVSLTVPAPSARPVAYRVAELKAEKKYGCVKTLKQYNDPENAYIKDAVGGTQIFTTWYDQSLPVSIRILPQGGAIVNAPGYGNEPHAVSLCLDERGPLLKFDEHTIRLPRGRLRSISFKLQNFDMHFTTTNPAAGGHQFSIFSRSVR